MGQLRDDFLRARLRDWRHVMDRNVQGRALRFRREREDGRQRRRTGPGHAGFSISTGAQTSLIAMLSPSAQSRRTARWSPAARITATAGATPSPLASGLA